MDFVRDSKVVVTGLITWWGLAYSVVKVEWRKDVHVVQCLGCYQLLCIAA